MASEGEINRFKECLSDEFDYDMFNIYYKKMTPLIRKLSNNIDPRRFNVTKDIIKSWFYDKLLWAFNKYYVPLVLEEKNEEKFTAHIINSLITFRSRTLRNAYSNQAEFNQNLNSFEELFEDSKIDLPEEDPEETQKKEKIQAIYEYMKNHLSADAYILFQIQLNPPPFFYPHMRSQNTRINTSSILEFFCKPKTKPYIDLISELRFEIDSQLENLKLESSEIN